LFCLHFSLRPAASSSHASHGTISSNRHCTRSINQANDIRVIGITSVQMLSALARLATTPGANHSAGKARRHADPSISVFNAAITSPWIFSH
jgi:hypothetical protein